MIQRGCERARRGSSLPEHIAGLRILLLCSKFHLPSHSPRPDRASFHEVVAVAAKPVHLGSHFVTSANLHLRNVHLRTDDS